MIKLNVYYKYYKTVTYPNGKTEKWYIIPNKVYGPLEYIINFV